MRHACEIQWICTSHSMDVTELSSLNSMVCITRFIICLSRNFLFKMIISYYLFFIIVWFTIDTHKHAHWPGYLRLIECPCHFDGFYNVTFVGYPIYHFFLGKQKYIPTHYHLKLREQKKITHQANRKQRNSSKQNILQSATITLYKDSSSNLLRKF